MTEKALIIFAKNPEIGKVKTRLALTLGNEQALSIYKELLEQTVANTSSLPFKKFVFYSDYIEQSDIWPNEWYSKELQIGYDLGERMKNAFAALFEKGFTDVVIIGTDCPSLTQEIVCTAFHNLKDHDVVMGPAEDGGYYLLGIKKNQPSLFENIKWSTETVLKETIKKCGELNWNHYLLPVLNDVDEEKDLLHWDRKPLN